MCLPLPVETIDVTKRGAIIFGKAMEPVGAGIRGTGTLKKSVRAPRIVLSIPRKKMHPYPFKQENMKQTTESPLFVSLGKRLSESRSFTPLSARERSRMPTIVILPCILKLPERNCSPARGAFRKGLSKSKMSIIQPFLQRLCGTPRRTRITPAEPQRPCRCGGMHPWSRLRTCVDPLRNKRTKKPIQPKAIMHPL